MSNKRKAELQRKLAMGAPPRPPAGLADRIKADIPKYVQPGQQPEESGDAPDRWIWKSTTAMRIAASIILLITTGLVTWRLVQQDVHPRTASRTDVELIPAITRTRTQSKEEKAVAAPAPPVAATASKAIEQPVEIPPMPAKPAVVAAAPAPRTETQQQTAREESRMAARDSASESISESITIVASAPVRDTSAQNAAFEAAPLAAPAPPPPPPPAAAPATEAGSMSSLQIGRTMGKSVRQEKTTFFGVSIDPSAFARLRAAIDHGAVSPADVDVEAIVNHFASEPATASKSYVLSTELSSPLEADRSLLRVSVDTPPSTSLRNARLSIAFDHDAVLEARRIGEAHPLAIEERALPASSVTVLYELKLKPNLDADAIIAKVGIEGADAHSSTVVRAGAARRWSDSSVRHRRATLAGIWAESLKSPSNELTPVPNLVRELAKANPSDRRTRELAAAVRSSAALPK